MLAVKSYLNLKWLFCRTKLLDKLYMFSVVSFNAKNKWHIGYFTEIHEEVLASASCKLKHENSEV